ncbi:hypothetical protein BCV69DRAFT_282692 [Microstroma glucosiphilum]|uniref:protein-tyrosine-phosphatase n=1 Tax=Pseudomicrostroma glucosiphilum TaxID=1684307 RepID=A0A316U8L2_9BASI|nr:hypothetical protein BCV69DRAFT_282692 [Pseudomicrostroma glucosiphilum]PWN21194.1 hypothetical protein BCV69DRAFT_282692 [Pseudomicrostroma glucosiphilum]
MSSTSRNAPPLPASDRAVQVLDGAALLARLELAQKQVAQGAKAAQHGAHQSLEGRALTEEGGEAVNAPYPKEAGNRRSNAASSALAAPPPGTSDEAETLSANHREEQRRQDDNRPRGSHPVTTATHQMPLLASGSRSSHDQVDPDIIGRVSASAHTPLATSSDHLVAPPPLLILDLRPLHSFLQTRLIGSINLALPSLIVKRIKRTSAASAAPAPTGGVKQKSTAMMAGRGAAGHASAAAAVASSSPLLQLSTYITTTAGKRKFQQILDRMSEDGEAAASSPVSPKARRTTTSDRSDAADPMVIETLAKSEVIVVCEDGDRAATATAAALEASNALCTAIAGIKASWAGSSGGVGLYTEDLSGLASSSAAESWLERGEEEGFGASTSSTNGLSQTAENAKASTSSLPDFKNFSLGSFASSSPMSSSGPSSPSSSGPKDGYVRPPTLLPGKKQGRPSLARLDTGEGRKSLSLNAAGTPSSQVFPPGVRGATSRSASGDHPRGAPYSRSPPQAEMSFQNLARLQSQSGPSAASFADMSLPFNPASLALGGSGGGGLTRAQTDRALARRGSVFTEEPVSQQPSHATKVLSPSPLHPGMVDDSKPAFDVSEIVPGFLYLGPDIATEEEVEELKVRGVKAILNCAVEVSDKSGKKGGAAKEQDRAASSVGETSAVLLSTHENGTATVGAGAGAAAALGDEEGNTETLSLGEDFSYLKLPLYDNVEALDVLSHLRTGFNFISSAHSQHKPVYVHCRAGKSRSVTVVIAYLMRSKGWSLSEAYDFVKARRTDVSPNIGFVSLLMEWQDQVAAEAATGAAGQGDGSGSGPEAGVDKLELKQETGAGHALPL